MVDHQLGRLGPQPSPRTTVTTTPKAAAVRMLATQGKTSQPTRNASHHCCRTLLACRARHPPEDRRHLCSEQPVQLDRDGVPELVVTGVEAVKLVG